MMAFFNRCGNILRQTVRNNNINMSLARARPSILQRMYTWNLFVGGLGQTTDDTNLLEAFSAFGEVSHARVIKNRKTGRSRGFGFVTFVDYNAAWDAIGAMDQWELHGRTVTVCLAKDSIDRSPPADPFCNFFVERDHVWPWDEP